MSFSRLIHGDYRNVLRDERADLIVTSPPYNIGSNSPAITGRRRKGGYDRKSYRSITDYRDAMSEDAYQDWQLEFLYWAAEHLNSGGTLCYNHKPRRRNLAMIHPMSWIGKCEAVTLMEEVIWDRGSTHNHGRTLMWPTTERVYVLRRTNDSYALDNYRDRQLPFRNDLWRIPKEPAGGHNAPFPEVLVEQCILAFTVAGQTVCDPFSGSGTVALISQRFGRNFVGAEKLKRYWKMAMRRVGGVDCRA